jgi:hypothetical protein
MNIQPLKSHSVPLPAKPAAKPATPPAEPGAPEAPAKTKRARHLEVLKHEPAVRAGEVERAKRLAADPNYPTDDILARIADRFVSGSRGAK